MQMTTYNPRTVRRPLRPSSQLLGNFLAPFGGIFDDLPSQTIYPAVDIYEKDEKLVFEAELPGFKKEKISVDVQGSMLTLSGERESSAEAKEEARYRTERNYGKFERSFKLPFEATEKQIQATYRDGILTLTVEKPEEQKPKQITIN